jgi:hypothetical protein
MGKPLTSFTDAEGHIRSPGHDAAGEAPPGPSSNG